ncbi:hypothetical protein ACO0OL_000461 [Hanseniaspora opuntiae]
MSSQPINTNQKRLTIISKLLSKILRHQAVNEGFTIDDDGYVSLDVLLKSNKFKSLKTTEEDIQNVLLNDKKSRAVQGHSIQTLNADKILTKITNENINLLPNYNSEQYFIIHGTSKQNYQSILESKYLKKMGRTHVHFTFEVPEDNTVVVSGFRNSSKILIFIEIHKLLMDDEFKDCIYLSNNNVILVSQDIPTNFIDHITEN